MNHSTYDYLTHVEDEIALEGLDGITTEALWVRLSLRHNFTSNIQLDEYGKKFLWSLIVVDEEIEFYALEEERPELKIFNRYDYIDSELGLILEPQEDILDIYPCLPVEDEVNGIRGSCATYKTRKNVTDVVCFYSLDEAVKKYGNKLVMVASQHLRDKALAINAAIDKFYDLTLMQYIMLERIARSRTMGEITHGKNSLTVMKVPAKTMFYYRKRLLKLNLITKQSHRQRSVKGNISSSSLLHLTRFYVIRRPKFMMLIQKVIEKLKMKPNFMCPLSEIKIELGLQNIANKKVLKSGDFQKHIQTVLVPYRNIFPNATVKEWKCKAKNHEKSIRCVKLINPSISIEELFTEEEENDEGNVEGGEEEDEERDDFEYFPGILNQSSRVYGRSLLQQAYFTIDSAGPNGMTQIDLSKKMGLSRLDSRTICRALLKRDVVHSLMKDIGRQRVSKFVSNRYATTGHLLKEYHSEMKKMLEIVQTSNENEEEEEQDAENIKSVCPTTPTTSRFPDADGNSDVTTDVNVEVTSPAPIFIKKESQFLIKSECHPVESEDINSEETDSDVEDSFNKTGSDNSFSGCVESTIKVNESTFNTPGKFSPRMLLKNKSSPHLTTRMMKRANIIMNAVRKQKVIDDSYKLQKMIIMAEENEGLEVKMDKKSLMRLIDRLSNSGYLKKFVVKFEAGCKTKVMNFIVDSSISQESQILKMSIEQQKNKFMLQAASSGNVSSPKKSQGNSYIDGDLDECRSSATTAGDIQNSSNSSKAAVKSKFAVKAEPSVGYSVLEMEEMHNLPITQSLDAPTDRVDSTPLKKNAVDVPSGSIKGNVGSKFVRMQEFHKLLFYLIYGYEGNTNLDQNEAWSQIKNSSKHDFSEEKFEDYPSLYLTEVSWKMFIPPLPSHPTVPVDGWIFVVDILLRIPLCIFIQIVSVTCESRLLMDFLNHPIKCNLLVKNLPPDLRRYLLSHRRYVTYVMELCKRLCYVGLLQMGKQIMKEKDQVFVYLNRNASLVDTTVSERGYTFISPDKDYVSKEYVFTSIHDVIQYWFDMWTICMHTPLGAQRLVEGKKLRTHLLSSKPEMIECTKPRNFEEAPQRDNGHIPGDQRGAAGLDSLMYAHLQRNWSCAYSRFNAIALSANVSTTGEKSTDRMFSYAQYLRNSCGPESVDSTPSKNKLAGLRTIRLSLYKPKASEKDGKDAEKPIPVAVGLVKRSAKRKKKEPKAELKVTKKVKSKSKSVIVKEFKTRIKGPKKPYYDEEDKAALRRMNKLRVDWSPAEDSLLLLCKVSSAYLFPHKKMQIINFSVVRDLLHSRFPESRNKTSKACQRRINYILKNPATEENVAIILEEVKQDEEITKNFKTAKLSYKLPVLSKLYVNTFKELVNRLVLKYASNESKDAPDLPNDYSDFMKKFKVITTSNSLKEGPKLRELNSIDDIDHYVVYALIFSSLCTKHDRESWAYQLYLVYQKYPQKLLNNVLTFIRESKMISYKKYYNRSKYIRTCLPLSTSPFQLSLSFIYMFHMKYTYDIFGSCWNMVKTIVTSKADALAKIAEHKRDAEKLNSNQNSSEISSLEIKKTTRGRKRKPRKIGIKIKSRGRGRPRKYERPVKMEMDPQMNSAITQDGGQEIIENKLKIIEEECGVELTSNLDGGVCSCIISLSANRRIDFSISIPDQLVAIDNQCQEKNGPRNKLLEKIEYRELVSGKKFDLSEHLSKTYFPNDEDIYTDKSDSGKVAIRKTNQNLCSSSSAYQDDSLEDINPEDDNPVETEKRKYFEDNYSDCKKFKLSESDIAQEENLHQMNFEELQKEENQRPKHNTNSRIRMYMMREMSDVASSSSFVCDNVFINTCEISCRLKVSEEGSSENLFPNDADLTDKLMPLSKDVVDAALSERKNASTWMKLEPALEIWKKEKKGLRFLSIVKKLFHFIELKKELGASASEIKEEFPSPHYNIMKILHEMKEMGIVLKVGVVTFRWVTVQYSKPWLIHTNKMSRAKMNSTRSVRLSGVYDVNEAGANEEESNDGFAARSEVNNNPEQEVENEAENRNEINANLVAEPSEKTSASNTDPLSNASSRPKRKLSSGHAKIALLKKKSATDARNAFDMENNYDHSQITSQYEEIDVLVRPWVRLNGCLNRRVMDRMLGAILCYIMENPGVSGKQISKRFWPALQPAHTYELLDTLMSLRAVKLLEFWKITKDTLFSEEQEFDMESPMEFDFNEEFKYEAEVDCVLKLSTFIGDRKYKQDFLATCR